MTSDSLHLHRLLNMQRWPLEKYRDVWFIGGTHLSSGRSAAPLSNCHHGFPRRKKERRSGSFTKREKNISHRHKQKQCADACRFVFKTSVLNARVNEKYKARKEYMCSTRYTERILWKFQTASVLKRHSRWRAEGYECENVGGYFSLSERSRARTVLIHCFVHCRTAVSPHPGTPIRAKD